MARMFPREAELVSEWTGLSGRAKSGKRFERFNGLDTALYKNIPFYPAASAKDLMEKKQRVRIYRAELTYAVDAGKW